MKYLNKFELFEKKETKKIEHEGVKLEIPLKNKPGSMIRLVITDENETAYTLIATNDPDEIIAKAKERIKALEEIEIKLTKMKKLTEYVRNNELKEEEVEKLNLKINILSNEISNLDKDSKNFWLDNQQEGYCECGKVINLIKSNENKATSKYFSDEKSYE